MYGGVLYCGVLRYGKPPLKQSRNKFSVRRHKKPMLNQVQHDNGGDAGIKKAPCEVYLVGGVNPAATYSPGPVGQVPSAMRGLTSVFGKGTGMTPSR